MSLPTFDDLIHAERGKMLSRLPPGAKTICSAGCAGRWYFDWVEKEYGPVALHVGVELFKGPPSDLPGNVRWVQNSVSQMVDVQTGSVDLLISGQNIEHLYCEDLRGFLSESNRVVADGGYLCIDSPNRAVTQEFGYTQPQHVLELTVTDVIELVEAAGFSVVSVNGIWNCMDGQRIRANPLVVTEDAYVRCAEAEYRPESAFIWWLLATKTGPVRSDLADVIDRIVSRSFRPFAASRFRKGIGHVHSFEGTEAMIEVSPAEEGLVVYGPYVPLRAGSYRAEFDVRFLNRGGDMKFEVTAQGGRRQFTSETMSPAEGPTEWLKVQLEFSIPKYTIGVETRVASRGTHALVRFGSQLMRL